MHGSAPSFSKFRQPFLPKVLVRDRLLKRLAENDHKNLWLINGQAAQGKTTLLADWVSQVHNPTAWVNCGPEDGPVENLFWSLLRAISLSQGRDLNHLAVEAGVGRAPILDPAQLFYWARLIYENSPEGAQLILDNLDQIPFDAASMGLVRALIEVLPPDRRLIILSRRELPDQAELVIKQKAFVLGNEELACNPSEVAQLMELMSGLEPPREQVQQAYRLTEGWIGGMVLFSEYKQNQLASADGEMPLNSVPDKIVGGVYDFFLQNIFNKLSRRIQEFLAKCSVFSVLDPKAVAEAAGEPEALEILEHLRQRHLFISAVFDSERGRIYRLHQVFRLFLKERYQQLFSAEENRRFLSRAGRVYAAHNYWKDSLRCYLDCGEHLPAAGTIKRLAPVLLKEGRLGELDYWLGVLPKGLIKDDPWLLYYQCQVWRWVGVANILNALPELKSAFTEMGDKRGLLAAQAMELDSSFAVGLPWPKLKDILEQTEQLLESVELEGCEEERAVLLSQYGFVHSVRGSPRKASWACEQASILISRTGNSFLACRVLLFHMDALNFMGELERSEQKKRELDARLKELHVSQLPAETFIPRCYLNILKGDLDQARKDLDQAQEMIDRAGLIYMLPIRLLYDCMWSAMAGQHERCQACFEQMHSMPPGLNPPFMLAASKVLLAISLFRVERNQEAWDWARESYEDLNNDQCRAPTHLASSKIIIALLARLLGKDVLSEEQDLKQAHEVLAEIGSRQHQTECELILCLFAWDRGERTEAVEWMQSSLAMRREKAYERQFIFLRPKEIAELLVMCAELGLGEHAKYWGEILAVGGDRKIQAQIRGLEEHPLPAVKEQARILRRRLLRRNLPKARINTLGSLQVKVGERQINNRQWGRKQVRHLLLALIALGASGVSREKIIEAIWPDADPQSAGKTLKVTLHRLRKVFEPNMERASGSSYIIQENGLLKLDLELCSLDIDEFVSLAKQAETVEQAKDWEGAAEIRERAARLYEGDFLSSEAYLAWCEEPRRRLRETHLSLLTKIAKFYEGNGQIGKAVRFYNHLIEVDPFNEYAYQRLMTLQAEIGLLAEAKRTYNTCCHQLKKGLDAEPGWNTRSLYERILEQAKLDHLVETAGKEN